MSTQKPVADLLAALLPGLSMSQQIEQAKAEYATKKAESEAAQKVVESFTKKENREQIRAQKRRDEIVGNLFGRVCEKNRASWTGFEPVLMEWLEDATDADRALFGLKKHVEEPEKVDTEEGSKAAERAGEKKEEKAVVDQPN